MRSEPPEEKEPKEDERPGRRRRRRKPRQAPVAAEGLQEAFWLDEQQHVWLRVGDAESKERFAEEAGIQRGLPIAGVLPVSCSGESAEGRPYLASPAFALPLPHFLSRGASGWQMDLRSEAEAVVSLAGGRFTWGLREAHRALTPFRDELLEVEGVLRLRSANNRAMASPRASAALAPLRCPEPRS